MPSEIAKQIVQQIFGDDKAKAIDSINDALGAASFDAIQQRKAEFAASMGFDLEDTAQDAADEIAAEIPDNTDTEPEQVDVDEPPAETEASAEEQPEETPEEENETDS
jgi:hypothetical protein|tara:strand:- start:376 stop:699 length:324 start_codon:yes stop_codon:yes gene_type:complete